MVAPVPNLTPSAAASAVDRTTGLFTAAWYRFFTSLIGPAAQSSVIAPKASPFTFTASQRGFLRISGGTVTTVKLVRGRVTFTLDLPIQFVPVSQSDTVTVSYSSIPALAFIPS